MNCKDFRKCEKYRTRETRPTDYDLKVSAQIIDEIREAEVHQTVMDHQCLKMKS